jgi:hypothetical protein
MLKHTVNFECKCKFEKERRWQQYVTLCRINGRRKHYFFGGGIFTATLIRSSRVARSLFVPALHYRSFVGGYQSMGNIDSRDVSSDHMRATAEADRQVCV